MPLARRLWKISKFYQLPFSDERIQKLNIFDINFCELSMLADDPKALERYKNTFYDPDFDEWLAEVENEAENPKKEENPFDYSEYEVTPQRTSSELANLNENSSVEENNTPEKENTLNTQIEGSDDTFTVLDTPDIDLENITDWEEI